MHDDRRRLWRHMRDCFEYGISHARCMCLRTKRAPVLAIGIGTWVSYTVSTWPIKETRCRGNADRSCNRGNRKRWLGCHPYVTPCHVVSERKWGVQGINCEGGGLMRPVICSSQRKFQEGFSFQGRMLVFKSERAEATRTFRAQCQFCLLFLFFFSRCS